MTEGRVKMVSGKQAVAYRNYRRARDRALARLANAHPRQYKKYLEEEKASDEQLGKRWIADNTNITVSSVGVRTRASRKKPSGRHKSKNKSNRRRKA